MKELSIKEKAKLYDKALERAMNVGNSEWSSPQALSEYIFPELAESEDEEIRKSLINYVYCHGDAGDFTKKEFIAWLEKQGKNPTTLPKWKYKKDNAPLLRDSLILNKYGCVAKSPSGALVSDVWIIDYDELAKLPKEKSEKQGEQKPKELFDIPENGIENDVSVTSRMEHVPEHLKSIAKFILEYAHWNLHKDEWNHPVPEVPLFRVLDALVQEGKPYQEACSCVVQKPVEEVNGEDYGIDGLYAAMDILNKTLGQVEGYQSDDGILEHKAAMTAIKKLYKQKPEWSEEDVCNIQDIDSVLFYDKNLPEDTRIRLRNWLKSLKDRVLPQPKQKWSKEDEAMRIKTLHHLSTRCSVQEYEEIEDWLKSLRPHNLSKVERIGKNWKPSEEQMKALESATENCAYSEYQDCLRELIAQLKKLREE